MYRGVLLHRGIDDADGSAVCERIVELGGGRIVHGVCGGQVRHYRRRRSTDIDRHMLEL